MDRNLFRRLTTYSFFIITSYCLVIIFNKMSDQYGWGFQASWDNMAILLPIILSILMIDVTYTLGKQNNRIQKDNIKLQLFDKRYKVYHSIVEAKSILERDDHYLNAFYDANYLNDLGRKLMAIHESLNDSMLVSQSLFDADMFIKMRNIVVCFAKVRRKYFELNIEGYRYRDLLTEQQLDDIRNIVVQNATNIPNLEKEMSKRLPDFGAKIKPWMDAVAEFNECIRTSHIMEDFDIYLRISNLDE